MNLYLNQEHQDSSISHRWLQTVNVFQLKNTLLSVKNFTEIQLKICTCRWLSERAKQVRDMQVFCFLRGEGDKKTCNGYCKSFQKRRIILKTHGYPYILCYEMKVASLFNASLGSGCKQKVFRPCFSWTRGRLSKMLKALLLRFCY